MSLHQSAIEEEAGQSITRIAQTPADLRSTRIHTSCALWVAMHARGLDHSSPTNMHSVEELAHIDGTLMRVGGEFCF
eukprot:m.368465 g.368465  ORF g.368465 m.368465 type:complete len:77 (+) comp45119_c0_seq1:237-467(+)